MSARPPLTGDLTGTELRRWYWLRSELVALARELGVSTQGGKLDLTERLAARLDGVEPPPPAVRRAATDGLTGVVLSGGTLLPTGQRSTQQLRAWFEGRIPGFRFDAAMRAYVAQGGHTLDDAADHWHATRGRRSEIGAQFELNAFARRWHADHPGGGHADMLAAWRSHRSLPREAR